MKREGTDVAEVVTFHDGTCVVHWETSTIVYGSEEDARDVHIRHIAARGTTGRYSEGTKTEFVPRLSTAGGLAISQINERLREIYRVFWPPSTSLADVHGGREALAKLIEETEWGEKSSLGRGVVEGMGSLQDGDSHAIPTRS